MGVKEYLISASVIGVVAQRLVRTICPHCKEQYHVDVKLLFEEFGVNSDKRGKAAVHRGKGCRYCNYTGYYGRTGIFEVMTINETLQDLILNN